MDVAPFLDVFLFSLTAWVDPDVLFMLLFIIKEFNNYGNLPNAN
jgi:hypothetical protein